MKRVLTTIKKTILLVALSFLLLACEKAHAAFAPAVSQKLPNGITLITRADQIAPRVSISLLVRAGAADETATTAGWRQVIAAAILRATKTESVEKDTANSGGARTLDAWQRWAQARGGQIGATVSDDGIEFWATGESRYSDELLNALLQIVSRPRLADSDLAAARRYVLEQAGLPTRGVARRAAELVARQLFHDSKGVPVAYGLPNFGTFESLSGLTNEQLRAWHAQYFMPARFTIAAAGDVEAPALRAALEKQTATMPQAVPSTPAAATTDTAPTFTPLKAGAPPVSVRDANADGAWVFIAFRAPAPSSLAPRAYAALHILSAALDGSASARLARRLLQDKSTPASKSKEQAAQVAAEFSPRRWSGELAVLAQTSPANLDAVKNALLDEVRLLSTAPLTNIELQNAKNFARGRWATNRETSHDRAFEAATAALVQPFPDTDWPAQISAVTATDIQHAAQKYLQTYAVVLILPQQ